VAVDVMVEIEEGAENREETEMGCAAGKARRADPLTSSPPTLWLPL
jgi:hypothetical protein